MGRFPRVYWLVGIPCVLLLGLWWGCTETVLGPPEAIITAGPVDGAVLTSSEVVFQWTGNTASTMYSYQLDDRGWSEWSPTQTLTLLGLDEGPHTLLLKAATASGAEQDLPIARSFMVDAVQGPALMIRPRNIEVDFGQDFVVEVMAEEVMDLMLARLILRYDASMLARLEVVSNWPTSFLASHGGAVVAQESAANTGEIDMSLGVALGQPAGVGGSGPLLRIRFVGLRPGSVEFSLDPASEIRDSQNQPIPLTQLVPGVAVLTTAEVQ